MWQHYSMWWFISSLHQYLYFILSFAIIHIYWLKILVRKGNLLVEISIYLKQIFCQMANVDILNLCKSSTISYDDISHISDLLGYYYDDLNRNFCV